MVIVPSIDPCVLCGEDACREQRPDEHGSQGACDTKAHSLHKKAVPIWVEYIQRQNGTRSNQGKTAGMVRPVSVARAKSRSWFYRRN
jgi:hypothetical protein